MISNAFSLPFFLTPFRKLNKGTCRFKRKQQFFPVDVCERNGHLEETHFASHFSCSFSVSVHFCEFKQKTLPNLCPQSSISNFKDDKLTIQTRARLRSVMENISNISLTSLPLQRRERRWQRKFVLNTQTEFL